jgi:hypothetical protein
LDGGDGEPTTEPTEGAAQPTNVPDTTDQQVQSVVPLPAAQAAPVQRTGTADPTGSGAKAKSARRKVDWVADEPVDPIRVPKGRGRGRGGIR